MLYHLLPGYADVHIVFNLFRYQTFRAAGAVVTALIVSVLVGPAIIRWLNRLRFGQVVRAEGPLTHLDKAGTPTMGGVLIILSAGISTLLWAELTNWYTVLCLLALIWLGLIGFLDDYLKVVRGKTEGLVARYKLLGQFGFGAGIGLFLLFHPISPYRSTWTGVPFFSDYMLAFWGPAYVAFVAVVLAGTSNAVNLSDGLDGLASGLIAIAAATFAIFAYVTGRIDTSAYLGLFYLPGAGEMAVFGVALSGAALGFLWFKFAPRRGVSWATPGRSRWGLRSGSWRSYSKPSSCS